MADKRLTFNINEDLHTRLKSEAAQLGISLGAHCASILGGEATASPPVEKVDTSTLSFYSLDTLRALSHELIEKRPTGWQQDVANVNAEMRKRFKT